MVLSLPSQYTVYNYPHFSRVNRFLKQLFTASPFLVVWTNKSPYIITSLQSRRLQFKRDNN